MKSFDKFAKYFSTKSRIEQELDSKVNEYAIAQILYEPYILIYGYDFLYEQANKLPASQMNDVLLFLSCCKEYESYERELFDEMCKTLHIYSLHESLMKYIPIRHSTLKSFIHNWKYDANNSALLILHLSVLIAFEMYSVDTLADYSYLRSFYELCRKELINTPLKYQSDKILNDIQRTVSTYCEQLGISDNFEDPHKVKDDGTFFLSWEYVTFTNKAIYLYHPNNIKSPHPFEYKTNASNSAFNSIKSYFMNRLPPIYVEAEHKQITKILNVQNIDGCIKKLTDKINADKQFKKTTNNKVLIPKNKCVFSKEIKDTYKSKYLDWLCSQQSDNYPIFYSIENRTNSDLTSTNEDAFIFILRTGMASITIAYENTNDSRSTLVFKTEASKINETIDEIHKLFTSNLVNKREQIANNRLTNNLFVSNKFCRVLHTDFENWRNKLMTL